MTQSKLILPGSPLIICPQLVTRLKEQGLKRYATDAAVFIQQLHYLLKMPNHGRVIEGIKWIYNSLTKWQKEIEWLTDYIFRTIKNKLIELGIIKARQLGLNDQGRDRSYWYTINYDHEIFLVEVSPISTDGSSEQSSDAKQVIESDASLKQSSDVYDPKITPKITNKITTTPRIVVPSLRKEYQEVPQPYPTSPEKTVNESFTKPTLTDHFSVFSDQRIKELEALGVNKITSALRKLVNGAEPKVFKDAIACVKDAVAEGGVRCPGAYLYSAIVERYSKGTVRDKREEEFDEAYQQLIESGIVEDVEKRYLSTRMGQYMVRLIEATQPGGYQLIDWREAMSALTQGEWS